MGGKRTVNTAYRPIQDIGKADQRLNQLLRYSQILGLVIVTLICSGSVNAAEWQFAPDGRLFRPLLADPGEARLGVFGYVTGNRLEGVIGGSWEGFGVGWPGMPPTRLKVGIHAGVFTLLRKSSVTFPLETADFLFGIHTDLQRGFFSGRFAFDHVSAHLVDGYNGPRQAFTYSREFFTLYGAYDRSWLRLYGGIRVSNHAIPNTKRWGLQAGTELTSKPLWGPLPRVYVAYDLRLFDDAGASGNQTAHAGLLFHNAAHAGLRIAFLLHSGRSEHGQFHDLPDRFAGVGIFFDL